MMSTGRTREAGRSTPLRPPASREPAPEEPRLESARCLENCVPRARWVLRVLLAGTRVGFLAGPGRRTFVGGIR